MSSSVSVFEQFAQEYDRWFDAHPAAYESEVEALRRFIPARGIGLDIGVGTGRFSIPFGITVGVDPSVSMAAIARSRGVEVLIASAERLPVESEQFDFALMVTTLCFVDNPHAALAEAYRILKPDGSLLLAFIDRQTQLGKVYEAMKSSDKFYRDATFYSASEVLDLLRQACFGKFQTCQTIFSHPDAMTTPDPIKNGHGEGAFVVVCSIKQPKETP